MNKYYWRIRGHDSLKTLFDMTVEIGQLSEKQIKNLLKALAAKEGLTYPEIVGAYAKRRTKIANDFLDVHLDSKYSTYRCGDNPTFTAAVVGEDRKVIVHPDLQ